MAAKPNYPHAWESQGVGQPRKEVLVVNYEYSVAYAAVAELEGPGRAATPKELLYAQAEGDELYGG